MTSMIILFIKCDGWYAPSFHNICCPSVNHSIWSKCDYFVIEFGVTFTFYYHSCDNCTWNSTFTGECVDSFYYTCYQWLNHQFGIISVWYVVCNAPTYLFHDSDDSFNNVHMFTFSIYLYHNRKKVLFQFCYVKLIISMNDGYIKATCVIFV